MEQTGLRLPEEQVEFFKHIKCGNKTLVVGEVRWCPSCRVDITDYRDVEHMSFRNVMQQRFPNRDPEIEQLTPRRFK